MHTRAGVRVWARAGSKYAQYTDIGLRDQPPPGDAGSFLSSVMASRRRATGTQPSIYVRSPRTRLVLLLYTGMWEWLFSIQGRRDTSEVRIVYTRLGFEAKSTRTCEQRGNVVLSGTRRSMFE